MIENGDEVDSGSEFTATGRARTRMVRNYPRHTLEEVLPLAEAIYQENAGRPYDRIYLARSVDISPQSSRYTFLLNSSAMYGLTLGGYKDPVISLTDRGEKAALGDRAAIFDAALEPDVFAGFYDFIDAKAIPENQHACRLLEAQFGVRAELSAECLKVLIYNALSTGIATKVGSTLHVNVEGAMLRTQGVGVEEHIDRVRESKENGITLDPSSELSNPIFVGHTAAADVCSYVEEVLDKFNLPYVVGESDPVGPSDLDDKLLSSMRSCSAGVLVFSDPGPELDDPYADEYFEKMQLQLGAARATFADKVIILREDTDSWERVALTRESILYGRERLEEIGIPLLAALYQLGIITVSKS